tara:strand:+ start:287 stop:505 length:219 start_codon:yes stop_codon:yes gene_type:complete
MKKGDIVELIPHPAIDWMEKYSRHLFEVKEVYERRCLVRMLNVANKERYWFSEKENFQLVDLEMVEIEEDAP